MDRETNAGSGTGSDAGSGADCGPCNDQHGWWGKDHDGTHCRRCHRSWASTTEAHCAACCAHFSSNHAADSHWFEGRHRDAAVACPAAGLVLSPNGVWMTPGDVERRDRLSAARSVREAS